MIFSSSEGISHRMLCFHKMLNKKSRCFHFEIKYVYLFWWVKVILACVSVCYFSNYVEVSFLSPMMTSCCKTKQSAIVEFCSRLTWKLRNCHLVLYHLLKFLFIILKINYKFSLNIDQVYLIIWHMLSTSFYVTTYNWLFN